jgi:hypothetical protein
MVHQHFSLVDELTCGRTSCSASVGRLDPVPPGAGSRTIAEHYGLDIDPDARSSDLPPGMRQRVEIIKCLRRDPGIVVFDEPTSVLTPQESEQLFAALRRWPEARGGRWRSSATSSTRSCAPPTTSPSCARQVVERRHRRHRRRRARPGHGRARPVSLRSEAGALGSSCRAGRRHRSRRRAAPLHRRPGLMPVSGGAPTVRGDGKVLLDGIDLEVRPARSSAWPASRATASGARRGAVEPASPRRRARSRSPASRSPRGAPGRWRGPGRRRPRGPSRRRVRPRPQRRPEPAPRSTRRRAPLRFHRSGRMRRAER